ADPGLRAIRADRAPVGAQGGLMACEMSWRKHCSMGPPWLSSGINSRIEGGRPVLCVPHIRNTVGTLLTSSLTMLTTLPPNSRSSLSTLTPRTTTPESASASFPQTKGKENEYGKSPHRPRRLARGVYQWAER